jgi:UDP-N-acetylmuramate: L-alanyl-gamma-D-glutamyl-meso-diaminopimelate ligase
MHLHILGICGTFMGGIAAIASAYGHRVTGCDVHVYPPMSTQLEALGIALTDGFGQEQLQGVARHADVFVIGNVVTRGNPLMEAILDAGLPNVSGPQWLHENVLRERWVVAVAGTHGKTTTSAMVTWILECAGLNPGFLIGGVPLDFDASARRGDGRLFVIEADEYDTAFFDKRSKFVHYHPRTAILNNLEYDHADIFSDLAAIETQFHHLVRTVPRSGRLIVNAEEASLARVLARGSWCEVDYFASADAALRDGVVPTWQVGADGDVRLHGASQGRLAWPPDAPQLGRHSRMNALAALAAAHHVGVPLAVGLSALSRFHGVRRRLELRGREGGVAVYDDFAHHPTAIQATIEGLRKAVGEARILAVLEPRSNTMRQGTMKEALPESLAGADKSFCFAANLGWDAAAVLSPLGARAAVHDNLDALVDAIARESRAGDSVLVMSNGGFGGIHEKLLARLASRHR